MSSLSKTIPSILICLFSSIQFFIANFYFCAQVTFRAPKENWFSLGGTEESIEDFENVNIDDGQTFFNQKW